VLEDEDVHGVNSTSIVRVTEGDEMPESQSKATDAAPEPEEPAAEEAQAKDSLLTTIAGRSEEAVRKVYGDLSENPRMQDAKERLGKASHSVLTQLGIASQDDLSALRDEVARLEQRLAVLEKAVASGSKARKDAPSA
jgi:polyhydroxyalkanoate synthesis regulator phasin